MKTDDTKDGQIFSRSAVHFFARSCPAVCFEGLLTMSLEAVIRIMARLLCGDEMSFARSIYTNPPSTCLHPPWYDDEE